MSGISKSITAIGETESTPANTEKYNALVRYLDAKTAPEFVTSPIAFAELSGAYDIVSSDGHENVVPSYVVTGGNYTYRTELNLGWFTNLGGVVSYPHLWNANYVLYRADSGYGSLQRSTDMGTTWASSPISHGMTASDYALATVNLTPSDVTLMMSFGGVNFTEDWGVTWEFRAMPSSPATYKMLAGRVAIGVQFVAISDNMSGTHYAAVTTDNGLNWTEYPIVPLLSYEVAKVIVHNPVVGRYLVVGDRGSVTTSINGDSWTARVENVFNNCLKIIVTVEGLYVACGGDSYYGWIATSTNGTTWTTTYTTTSLVRSISCITEGGVTTSICALTNYVAVISRNATATGFVPIYQIGPSLKNLAESPQGTIVGVGEYQTYSSDGGVTWLGLPVPYIATMYPLAVSADGWFMTAHPDFNRFWVSHNGTAWAEVPSSGHPVYDSDGLAFTQGKFVAVSPTAGNVSVRDEIATAWTDVAILGANQWSRIAVNARTGRVLIVSTNSTYYTDDLVTFTSVSGIPSYGEIRQLSFASSAAISGLFVGVWTNVCWTTPNGITWTKRNIPAGVYKSVACNPRTGRFFAVGTNCCATSPDGISWTAVAIPAGDYVKIIFSSVYNKFIASAEAGAFSTTSNILEFLC